MRKIMKEITLYSFDELSEEKQDKVISDYIGDLLSVIDVDKIDKKGNLYKAIKKAEELQTPWFTMQYVYDYCKDDVLDVVRNDEYYSNGELYTENDFM